MSYCFLVVVLFLLAYLHIFRTLLQALKQSKMTEDGIQDGVKIEDKIKWLVYEENNKIPTISAALGFQLCK